MPVFGLDGAFGGVRVINVIGRFFLRCRADGPVKDTLFAIAKLQRPKEKGGKYPRWKARYVF